MADDIGYSRNNWSKGDVLTAQKLNANEIALETVINRVNGKNSTGTLDTTEQLATKADINSLIGTINNLDYTSEGNTTKTITQLNQSDGLISAKYGDIQKATASKFGIVKIGQNLTVSNGLIALNSNLTGPIKITGDLNIIRPSTGEEDTTNNNYQLQVSINKENQNDGIINLNHYDAINERAFNFISLNLQQNQILIGTTERDSSNELGERKISTTIGALTVNRDTILGTDTLTNGTHNYGGTLVVNATAEFKNNTNFNGAFTKFEGAQVIIGTKNGNVYGGSLSINASTEFNNTTTFKNTVNFNNAATFNNTITFNNAATFNNDLNFTNLKLIPQTINYKNNDQQTPSDHIVISTEVIDNGYEAIDNSPKNYIKNINIDGENGPTRIFYSYYFQQDTITIGDRIGNTNSSASFLHLRGQNITLGTSLTTTDDNSIHYIGFSSDKIKLEPVVQEITWGDTTMKKRDFQALLALVQEANNNDSND